MLVFKNTISYLTLQEQTFNKSFLEKKWNELKEVYKKQIYFF
jgi:hypothetical protein